MADQYYSNNSLLLPMSGANNGTVFTDYSPVPKIITRYGDVKTVTAESKFYGSSAYFDGSGDFLAIAYSPYLDLNGGAFSIELYLYPTFINNQSYRRFISAGGGTVGWNSSTGIHWTLRQEDATGRVSFVFWSGTASAVVTTEKTLVTNAWNHLYVGFDNTNLYLSIEGEVLSQAVTMGRPSANPVIAIGTIHNDYSVSFTNYQGYIQDVRIIKGIAIHTNNFTPPGKLIYSLSGTVYDDEGVQARRTVIAVPRSYPISRTFITQSSDVDGTYSLAVPDVECSRIVLADEATLYNDIVDRVLPG